MRVLFIVQGEGRGHLTQALSLAQLLKSAGHEVTGALVSVTEQRNVPAFFRDAFDAPITPIFSPGLFYNPASNALQPTKTTLYAIRHIGGLWRSLQQVYDIIEQQRPDVVMNFFEMLGGLTYGLLRPSVPMVCVAHQYMAFHPNFQRPKGQWLYRLAFKLSTHITCFGAEEMLALSFDQQPDAPQQRVRIVPPLLRQEVTQLKPVSGDSLLAYVTQPGLRCEVEKAHQQHPAIPIDGFHAQATGPDQPVDETLTYHAIDGKRFLEFMARSRAVVTTAGFESVCEAAYLGKPVLMIPQPNHYEQACNAIDGQRAGVGVASDKFDLDQLLDYLPNYDASLSERFRAWHGRGYFLFLAALNRAITPRSRPTSGFFMTRMRQLLRS
ncbi:glycosyltransferase family protein [Spirosoma rhododendri]|uniref:Glycosyltransferase n=1 Tax=Spirosoma rhododendri TaxID=2728024 RepID=A0A7L5DIC5_9BACT|nr:glycosyltransferase family protein [Spirosoma rhododendri]QJD78134.1 glycosyltransferase [Spirosoma rhododendri]